mmetsp:Transcript_12482/g.29773  ORF Transcript_12482/g.29773 Transcript_12482/m.29773 type:complete len:352 (+) Transcript_12482:1-1056(+)
MRSTIRFGRTYHGRFCLSMSFISSRSRNLSSASSTTGQSISRTNRLGITSLGRTSIYECGRSRHSSSVSNTTSLSKLISNSTNYSRRELERLISRGDVTIKGECVENPRISLADLKEITKGGVTVKVKGKPVIIKSKEPVPRVWAVHKLSGELVGEKDPQNRPSMLERLKRGGVGRRHGDHLKPVGRLDIPTEGLILITNDGNFARELELPKNKIHRVYRARVHGTMTENKLMRIRNGHFGFQPMKVEVERRHKSTRDSSNTWVRITATEGQNRQIRKVFQSIGMSVTRLIRIAYGDYQLHSIPPGLAIPVPWKPVAKQKRKGSLFKKKNKRHMTRNQETASVKWMRGFQP